MSDEQQTRANADDPSGDGWRDVGPDELLQPGDMFPNGGQWERTGSPGSLARYGHCKYRRRIEPQQEQQPQPEPQPNQDDPSGPGWRDVEVREVLRHTDMFRDSVGAWVFTENEGLSVPKGWERTYRRRIEPQQPSESEPETMEMRLAKMTQWNLELEALVAEAERSGEQVNAELQQLREQVATLTRALRAERDNGMTALRSQHRLGQEAAVELIEAWLKPVVELMAEQPEDHAELAIVILGYLPQIAGRLIEEE